MTSVMTILDYLDANFTMRQAPAVRLCDVIKGHQNVFANNFGLKKELQLRAWFYCVQLIKPQSLFSAQRYTFFFIVTLTKYRGG